MQAHHIGRFQQRLEGNVAYVQARFFLRTAPDRIVINDGDIKTLQATRHLLANIAHAHQPDGFPLQLKNVHGAWYSPLPPTSGHIGMECYKITVYRQNEHYSMLRHRH